MFVVEFTAFVGWDKKKHKNCSLDLLSYCFTVFLLLSYSELKKT